MISEREAELLNSYGVTERSSGYWVIDKKADYLDGPYFTLEEAQAAPIDLGDTCVDCFKDTSFGSGKFVNRYPVSGPLDDSDIIYDGYRCEECDLKHAKEIEEDN